MKKPITVTLISLSTFCICQPALSWWATGHALTAEVAKQHLTATTEKRVNTLLQRDIDFPALGNNSSSAKVSPMALSHALNTMATSSTWADDIKHYYWKNYSAKLRFGSMHYVDVPINLSTRASTYCQTMVTLNAVKKQAGDNHKANIVNGIRSSLKTLLDAKADDTSHAVALRFLVHFMGDLHQPLHASDPTVHQQSSRGGNELGFMPTQCPSYIQVKGRDPHQASTVETTKEMHAFFDGSLGLFAQLPETIDTSYEPHGYELWQNNKVTYTHYLDELAAQLPSVSDTPTQSNLILNWALSSTQLACELLISDHEFSYSEYAKSSPSMHVSFKTDPKSFVTSHGDQIKRQLALGGIRLAELLNAVYDPTHANSDVVIYLNQSIVSNDAIPELNALAGGHA